MLEIFNQWRKQLRIRYLGLIEVRGVRQFCVHDLGTNTNFHVPRLEQLEQTLAAHRQTPNRKKMLNKRSSQGILPQTNPRTRSATKVPSRSKIRKFLYRRCSSL